MITIPTLTSNVEVNPESIIGYDIIVDGTGNPVTLVQISDGSVITTRLASYEIKDLIEAVSVAPIANSEPPEATPAPRGKK